MPIPHSPEPVLPEDFTATAETNFIKDELHTVTEVNAAPYRILIPTYAPFYVNDHKLVHVTIAGDEEELHEHADFYFTLPYMAATRSCGRPLYGGVMLINELANGTVKQTYRALGGNWSADRNWVYRQLMEDVYNPRFCWWDQLSDVQDLFPPHAHENHLEDITGMEFLVNKLEEIITVLKNPNNAQLGTLLAGLNSHVAALGNVHGLTKSDLNLGLLDNIPMATDEEVKDREKVEKYVTLRQVVNVLDKWTPDLTDFTKRFAPYGHLDDGTAHDARFDYLENLLRNVIRQEISDLKTYVEANFVKNP